MTDAAIPEGFQPHFRKSAFTDPWEPLFSRVSDRCVEMGLVLAPAHCNSRGLVHGGLIASLADNAMGLSCAQMLKEKGRDFSGLVTINLSTDYVGSAKLGEWLQVIPEVVKTGGSIAFVRCLIESNSAPVAQAKATFKILSSND